MNPPETERTTTFAWARAADELAGFTAPRPTSRPRPEARWSWRPGPATDGRPGCSAPPPTPEEGHA